MNDRVKRHALLIIDRQNGAKVNNNKTKTQNGTGIQLLNYTVSHNKLANRHVIKHSRFLSLHMKGSGRKVIIIIL